MFYYASETITGVANATKYGDGLTSTEVSRKRVKSIYVVTSTRAGNYLELWLEKERIAQIHDDVINIATDNPKTEIDLDVEIPVGQTLIPALRCGGTATTITIVYKYEEIR